MKYTNIQMHLSNEEIKQFDNATFFHLCFKKFNKNSIANEKKFKELYEQLDKLKENKKENAEAIIKTKIRIIQCLF